jgi:two-component system sensor histidine kinase KdpD
MSPFLQKIFPYAQVVVLVAVVTGFMWLARDVLTLANFSLLYLFVVLLIAMTLGTKPSLLATILSFLAFNFFLVKPLYTFAVADVRELIDLMVFLILAVLTGQLEARARLASERARKSKEFEEADRLKTALLRAVSHDLRTPITIIKTSANNLLNLHQQISSEERVEMLKAIDSEVEHLNKMIGNLLDMSRLQAGALNLNIRLNTLEEVAGDVAARVWQLTNEERIKILFPEDMPLVPFDYGLMLQALTNLVDNALRYEPAHLQVEIRGNFDHNHAYISVVNHGPNITAEERERITEPFYHGKDGHVGLGLPITKGIIDAHHGTLRTDDTPNGGATFVISLPLAPESVQQKA